MRGMKLDGRMKRMSEMGRGNERDRKNTTRISFRNNKCDKAYKLCNACTARPKLYSAKYHSMWKSYFLQSDFLFFPLFCFAADVNVFLALCLWNWNMFYGKSCAIFTWITLNSSFFMWADSLVQHNFQSSCSFYSTSTSKG